MVWLVLICKGCVLKKSVCIGDYALLNVLLERIKNGVVE